MATAIISTTPVTRLPTFVTVPLDTRVVQSITRERLFDMLSVLKGATIITFVAKTEPKMRKTGNPFVGNVWKWAKVNGILNFHYDKAVLKRLEKEGKSADEFKQGSSWHEPVMVDNKLTPFCKHKTNGKFYLRFMLKGAIESEYRQNDGTPIDFKDIEKFIPEKSDYANQGTDDPIIFLTYGLESIQQITMNGETFQIID
jgi:hypothetical protein